MTNKTFEPVGLLDIAKQIKTSRKSVDDLEERLHSALDAKRDVASNYVEQLDATTFNPTPRAQWELEVRQAERAELEAEKEVEVRNDPMTDLISNVNKNMQLWNKAIADSYQQGYDDGYKAGRDAEMTQQIDSMTLGEVSQELVRGGISVADQDQLVDDVEKMIEDKDEDEPDQYPNNYGGTK